MDIQILGGLVADWNTLPGLTPYIGQTGETPWGAMTSWKLNVKNFTRKRDNGQGTDGVSPGGACFTLHKNGFRHIVTLA